VEQSSVRRDGRQDAEPPVVDLTAHEHDESSAGTLAASERVRAFYLEHTGEVLARMRKPTNPTNNIAAGIVMQCETDPVLRAEAEQALEVARKLNENRSPLDIAISYYEAPNRL
jgi:hypothetical protein